MWHCWLHFHLSALNFSIPNVFSLCLASLSLMLMFQHNSDHKLADAAWKVSIEGTACLGHPSVGLVLINAMDQKRPSCPFVLVTWEGGLLLPAFISADVLYVLLLQCFADVRGNGSSWQLPLQPLRAATHLATSTKS
ncbi:hypothetical protein R1flu_000950 [Riccia fluitans]|uniref:Uncharacterized protein n=1 Tax=Riccia fluitans TaxID=41844 RepID=A0ABD1Y1W9_9MARC